MFEAAESAAESIYERGAAVFWSAGWGSPVLFFGAGLGFAAAFGFAGFASGLSAAFGAASGLAFACRAAGLPADFGSASLSLAESLAVSLLSAAASGFFDATRTFLLW